MILDVHSKRNGLERCVARTDLYANAFHTRAFYLWKFQINIILIACNNIPQLHEINSDILLLDRYVHIYDIIEY